MEVVYVVQSTNYGSPGLCVEAVYSELGLAMDHAKAILDCIAGSRGLVSGDADVVVVPHQVLDDLSLVVDHQTGLVI